MNTQFDNKLKEIKTLKLLPFIGCNYLLVPKEQRLLIVGESHYQEPDKIKSIQKHEDQEFTRRVINELAINREYGKTKIFQNLHKAIIGNDNFDTSKFWNSTAFYNFIQEPMNTNKGRPNKKQHKEAWETFFKLIKVIEPKFCLFIGVGAANLLEEKIKSHKEFKLVGKIKKHEKINNSLPRTAIIQTPNNQEIKLLFIKHTSNYFSPNVWHNFIEKEILQQLTWINNEKFI